MSNSPLVKYTKISPNKTSPRNHVIDTITIHCVVGQCSIETLGEIFAPASRQASSNYGIGVDGRVGMYVEEKDRSWCSSSSSNDNRAVTIEVASDTFAPYAVNDKAYKALIELVADICKRNNIKELKWKADKNLIGQVDKQNMTVHKWFANKDCPGEYLYSRHGDIASKVNKILGVNEVVPEVKPEPEKKPDTKLGYRVQVAAYSDKEPAMLHRDYMRKMEFNAYTVKTADKLYKVQIGCYELFEDASAKLKELCKAGFKAFVTTITGNVVEDDVEFSCYKVRVSIDNLNVRKAPTTNSEIVMTCPKGVYTIVDEANGEGATKWGKLKSGIGWISLDYAKKV